MDQDLQIYFFSIASADNRGVDGGKKIAFVGIELFDEVEVFFKLLLIEGFQCSSKQADPKEGFVLGCRNDLPELFVTDRFIACKLYLGNKGWRLLYCADRLTICQNGKESGKSDQGDQSDQRECFCSDAKEIC